LTKPNGVKSLILANQLSEIHTFTLILSGEYDESTPFINQALHEGIQNSEWIVFEDCSHPPHLEATEKYLDVLNRFLNRIESNDLPG